MDPPNPILYKNLANKPFPRAPLNNGYIPFKTKFTPILNEEKLTREGKVWYTHYKSYITRSYLEPVSNLIIEEKIPYNQHSNFQNFLKNYFQNDLH
jgi:hypothetical protein